MLTKDLYHAQLRKSQQLSTRISLLVMSITAVYGFVFLGAGVYSLALLCATITGVFGAAYWLNKSGKLRVGRITLYVILNLTVFVADIILGRNTGLFLLYIPIMASSLILFGFKEKNSIILVAAFSVFLFVLLEITNHTIISVTYKLTREANYAIYYTTMLLSIVATVMCVYYLRSVNYHVESRLIEQRTFYENIFENLPADVAVFDKHHRYIYINPKGERDASVRKWMVGKDDFNYCEKKNLDKSQAERRRHAFNRCVVTLEPVELEETSTDNKGNTTYHLRSFNPILNDQSEVTIVIGYGIDITSQKQAQFKILEAKQLAENASRAKSNFLSNISHEIRTPLNAIIGLSNLLISDNKRENLEENLKIISYSANNLLALINDILDLSKIEEGKITAEKTPFSINELLSTLEKTIRIRSEEKKLDLITDFAADLPPVLTGDPLRLNQILLNLCTNAVKFTEEGSVTIKVRMAEKKEDSVMLHFEVRDTGIGISPQKIETIFDSFTQAESYTTRKYGGTGLGLNISKKLCDILGGSIRVESNVNLGSTFYVSLPFGYSHDTELLKANSNTQHIKDLSHLNILMAEDNLINQRLAQQLFNKWNCNLSMVSSGRKALEELKKEKFDMLLMDLQMPDMDGLTALQLLRSGEAGELNRNIPAIALTADVFEETRKKVYESGFNDFLSKPFNNEDLYRKITQRTNPDN